MCTVCQEEGKQLFLNSKIIIIVCSTSQKRQIEFPQKTYQTSDAYHLFLQYEFHFNRVREAKIGQMAITALHDVHTHSNFKQMFHWGFIELLVSQKSDWRVGSQLDVDYICQDLLKRVVSWRLSQCFHFALYSYRIIQNVNVMTEKETVLM